MFIFYEFRPFLYRLRVRYLSKNTLSTGIIYTEKKSSSWEECIEFSIMCLVPPTEQSQKQ